MFGVSIPFKVAVSRKFKAFGWGWFCESTVPVGQAVPNKPVVAPRKAQNDGNKRARLRNSLKLPSG